MPNVPKVPEAPNVQNLLAKVEYLICCVVACSMGSAPGGLVSKSSLGIMHDFSSNT